MALAASIAAQSVLAFAVVLLLIQLLANGFGYWLGRRRRDAATGGDNVGVIVGGMLGLLAFVLALTLSFANGRFAERRAGTLAEANAIGTAWLRAEAVDHARGPVIAKLLEEYVRVRREFVSLGTDEVRIGALNQQTNALQSQIWTEMTGIVRDRPDAVSVSLMAAINDVFDMSATERFAFTLRLPPQLFWLLIGMTALAMLALGYQLGLKATRFPILVVALTVMWTAVIVDILDLAAPRLGTFRTDTAPYDWTIQGFSSPPVRPSPKP